MLAAVIALLLFPTTAFAEESGPYRIEVDGPEPGQMEYAFIEIQVTDLLGAGWAEIIVTTTSDGLWYDLTEGMRQYGKAAIRITENTDIVVTVTAPDGTQYKDSRRAYLFSQPQDSDADAYSHTQEQISESTKAEETASTATAESEPETDKKTSMEQSSQEDAGSSPPMNTDGSGTVIDNAVVQNGREFFTFQTPLGNVYYLIVDRNKDSENVYFVNAVTEQDLLALAEDASWVAEYEGASSAAVPEPSASAPSEISANDPAEPSETSSSVPEDETEPPPEDGGGSPLIIVGIVLVIALGAGYYFKIVRPKKELDSADDLEDIEYLDDDDDYDFADGDMTDDG